MSADGSVCCLPTLTPLSPGDRVCCLYSGDAERGSFVAAWLGSCPDAVAEALVTTGRLRFLTVQRGPMGEAAGGSVGGALPETTPPTVLFSLVIDMPAGDSSAVEEYEAFAAAFAAGEGCAALCLYDRRRFPAATLVAAMEKHQLIASGGHILRNPCYRPAIASDRDPAGRLLDERLDAIGQIASLWDELSWRGDSYSNVFLNCPIGIEVFDGEGHLIDANPAALEMKGIPDLASVLGSDLLSMAALPSDAYERLRAGERLHFETVTDSQACHGEGGSGSANSAPVYRDVMVSRLRTSVGYLVQPRNTSDQRRAEEALKRRGALFRSLVEQTPMVIYSAPMGSAGGEGYANPQIERMLGFSAEEWAPDLCVWQRQIHPADRERVYAAERRLRAGESDFSEVYRYYARDGCIVWVQDQAAIVRTRKAAPSPTRA